MQVKLCRKSLERLGAVGAALPAQLDAREHTVVLKDCLDRCQGCQLGLVIATADGTPLSARTVDKFLADLDALADDA